MLLPSQHVGQSLIVKIIQKSWILKKKLSKNITNEKIEKLSRKLQSMGLIVEKLLGAGNGDFLLAYKVKNLKEIFNIKMLSKSLIKKDSCDVLATLVEFTAESIAKAILKNKHASKNIIVCGGGGNNTYLLERISKLSNREVILSDDEGYNIQSIESMAFAWLGYKRINNQDLKIQLGKNKFNKGILGSITRARR